jgi:hypothetical protein
MVKRTETVAIEGATTATMLRAAMSSGGDNFRS